MEVTKPVSMFLLCPQHACWYTGRAYAKASKTVLKKVAGALKRTRRLIEFDPLFKINIRDSLRRSRPAQILTVLSRLLPILEKYAGSQQEARTI